ncbi:hypothetical protein NW752_003080 [Fusarium irregulare]|uniref:Uncharacterized protein n=1 Tax=Fusarium irregulare TaxID=2494466 RepID=A0A9W8Q0E0_9HYPO|nr:hypothetical protein NW766_000749 [Fusarium irregulare]KAJ4025607.1 hypothetical protein NW752_003080 [Fusarium irregulare]
MGRGRDHRDRSRSPRNERRRNHRRSRSGSRRRNDDHTRRSRHDSPQRYRSSSPRGESRDASHRRDDRSRTSRRQDETREFYERRYVDLLRENDTLRQDIRTMQTTHQDELAEARRNAEASEAQNLASVQLREDLRSSQQELQAKEVLFLGEKKRLLEELKSAKQSLAPTPTAGRENNDSSPKPSQEPKNFRLLEAFLLNRLNHLNLLDDEYLTCRALQRLSCNVASNYLYRQLRMFQSSGPLNRWFCLTHVEDKGEKVEFPPNWERCKEQGHNPVDCLIVRVIEKDSVRRVGVGVTTYSIY